MERAGLKKSIAGIIFELDFNGHSFRLYGSGKVIFRGLESKDELNAILSDLLL